MKITNFIVFNTTKKHGQMNTAAAFYPEGMEESERIKLMREHKEFIGKEIGFDINKIFMSLQANAKHPYEPGTSYTLTKEDVENYEDLYNYDVWADTVKLTPATPNCVIGFNVSDAPNVIAMNTKTMEATSTFCSGAHINNKVPMTIKDTLGGNPEDMIVSISPFAHVLPWYADELGKQPSWISNEEVWNDCIEKHGSLFLINMKKALLKQLVASGIDEKNIVVGEDSLYRADQYYSSQRVRMLQDPSQDGRFMHGVFLQENDSLLNSCQTQKEMMEEADSLGYAKVYPLNRK